MDRIIDSKIVNNAIKDLNLDLKFETGKFVFSICKYQKGELITSPYKKQEDILIVSKGRVQIFALKDEGNMIPITIVEKGIMIGDVEYLGNELTTIFSEATEDVICLAINIKENEYGLKNNVSFLNYMLKSLVNKVYLLNSEDVVTSVEERFRNYLLKKCSNGIVVKIQSIANEIGCSRRQLERIINKLCESGELIRLSKGKYKYYKAIT